MSTDQGLMGGETMSTDQGLMGGEWFDTRPWYIANEGLDYQYAVPLLESVLEDCEIKSVLLPVSGYTEVWLEAGHDTATWSFGEVEDALWAHHALAILCRDGMPAQLPQREALLTLAQAFRFLGPQATYGMRQEDTLTPYQAKAAELARARRAGGALVAAVRGHRHQRST